MKDALGDRMKANYEDRTRISLPRRSYTIIRIDGKAFHTYTKGLERPFDNDLIEDMNETAAYLCKNIMGAKFAFVQSDEISILLTDFEDITTQSWFDSNLQKICSVSASMATSEFNMLRINRVLNNKKVIEYKGMTDKRYEKLMPANFDSRVFQIPQKAEVENYFIWRQQDATRNSISAAAQSVCSHKDLHGKNTDEQQELMFQKGINWNDYPVQYKRGRMISKENDSKEICEISLGNMAKIEQVKKSNPDNWYADHEKMKFYIKVKTWKSIEVPIFTQDREFLNERIPNNI